MNLERATRECTPVYLDYPGDLDEIGFLMKEYQVRDYFAWQPFESKRRMKFDTVEDLLLAKQEELAKLKEQAKREEEERKKEELRKKHEAEGKKKRKPYVPKSKRLTWKQKINLKRQQVAVCLGLQSQPNLTEVMRWTGCSFYLVKKVFDELAFSGEVPEYHYPQEKTPAQLAQLTQSIAEVNGTFATIADLKRKTGFCRKFIARHLHQTGHRWQLVRKNELKPTQPAYTHEEVLKTVRHLSQSLTNSRVQTYYIDEVHFPLWQTSDHHWTLDQFNGHDLWYNRRTTPGVEKLSVIAMCSTERFVAVQVFKREICGQDFLYFLQEALTRVPNSARITVLADNATWHTAAVVMTTEASKAIEFNAPGLFQANLIENAFSFVRAEFRKRPIVHTVEDETRQLLRIFFDDRNTHRFRGIYRNHIRSLLALLTKHYAALHCIQQDHKAAKEAENLTKV